MDHIDTEEDIKAFVHQCRVKGQIPELWEDLIPTKRVFDFCRSSLGQRMARALKAGRLFRERPFVMGIPVKEVYPELEEGEHILIQGVIDVFFEEEDGVVLVDYKTDRVQTEAELKDRYREQLRLYTKALEQIIRKKVKEQIIYSFTLRKEIHLEDYKND